MLQGKTHVVTRPSDPYQNNVTLVKSDALPANISKIVSGNMKLAENYSKCPFSDKGSTPVKIVRSHSTLKDRNPIRTLNFEYFTKLPALERQCITCLDISGRNFNDKKISQLGECKNLTFINASDNTLSVACFKQFEKLRTLDLSLNEIYGLKPGADTLLYVVELDLSFNFVRPDDLLVLGTFPSLCVLRLTGNEIAHLPEELLKVPEDSTTDNWFSVLEELHLDSNKLKDAAAIARLSQLPRLRYLNLASNEFTAFPILRLRGHLSNDSKDNASGSSHEILNAKTKHPQSLKPKVQSVQSLSRRKAVVTTTLKYPSPKKLPYPIIEPSFKKAPLKREQIGRTLCPMTKAEAIQGQDSITNKSFYGSWVDYDEVVVPRSVAKFVRQVLKKGQLRRKNNNPGSFEKPRLRKSNLRRLNSVESFRGIIDRPLGSNCLVSSASGNLRENSLFPCLEKLDLSFNQIRDDEEILPVIVCPKLQAVVLEGNPITTQRTKISREVEEILSRHCGINIQIDRFGAKEAERRFGERLRKYYNRKVPKMDIRSEYKVKSRLPSLKKLDVDEALRKQREEDRQRNLASSISINRDSQSGEEISDKTSPNTSSDLVSTESHSREYSLVAVQLNDGKNTSVDSCFATQLDVEADPAVTNEESVVQPLPCPLLPDLDMSMNLSTLPTTIQNCLKELRDLVSCDDLHLAKMFKPLNMSKENEQGVAKSGLELALEDRTSPVLKVNNPFAQQLSQFTSVAMKTTNLSTVIEHLEIPAPAQRRQDTSVAHSKDAASFSSQSRLFSELQKNLKAIKQDRLQEARDEVSKIAAELTEDLQSSLQYDLLSSDV